MKQIRWVILLVVLVYLGDRVGGYLLNKVTLSSGFRYSRMYNGDARGDILIIGNSRGLGFYQPYMEEISGKSTFNLSYNGLPVDLAKVLTEDYLSSYNGIETALIDITICDRFDSSLVAAFSPYRAYSDRLDTLILSKAPKSFYGGKVSWLYRYNSEVFQRALFYLNKSDETWLLDRKILEITLSKLDATYSYDLNYPSQAITVLYELIRELQRKNIKVHLLVSPYYPPFARRMSDLEQLVKEVEKVTGMTVHNYSRAIDGKENFGDFQHLNKKGSKKYIRILYENGYFN